MLEKIAFFPFITLIRNKSVQNFIFLAIIQASNVLISLITMPLLITSLGVDRFGLVNLALSVVVLANIFVSFGFNLSAPREVAINQRDNSALSNLVSDIFSAKLILASVAAVSILVGVYGFNLFPEYQTILVFSLLLLFSEATMPLWFFQGMEKMKLISIANIFSKLLFLMGIVLFIHNPEQAKWVNMLLGGTALSINLLLLTYIHYEMDIVFFIPKIKRLIESIQANTLFFLSILASHISVNGGLIILSFYASPSILGMFSLAEKIGLVLRMFPALVIQAVYPNASKLYHQDKEAFYGYAIRISKWAFFIGLLISLGTHFAAPYIIQILSKEILPEAVVFLKILAFVPLLACINNINVVLFLVKNQKNLMFKSSWMMCLYMLITSVTLTHYFGGTGLSFALISSELMVFFICIGINIRYNRQEMVDIYHRLFTNKN
jgi:O-antigen/teichoic acid export membrane protein